MYLYRPYTPMMGHQSTVWFNRKKISPFVAEDESVNPMCEKISELIDLEIKNGVPFNRIIIGECPIEIALWYSLISPHYHLFTALITFIIKEYVTLPRSTLHFTPCALNRKEY